MRIFIDILFVISIFFALAGVVGMLRMPDTFCRMQSSTNIATMGILGIIIGALLYAIFFLENPEMAIKIGVLGVFYIITNPIAGHAICKGAYKHGVRPDKPYATDKYGEDLVDEE